VPLTSSRTQSGLDHNTAWWRTAVLSRSASTDILLQLHGNEENGICRSVFNSSGKSYKKSEAVPATGLWDVEDPTLSRQWAHRWRQGCQP
jgi:hypothetical protein